MINLFRKIRKRLISESKIGQFLIYSIGEIFLVVIGILFALGINNWNENRKLQKKEISTVENIIEEVEFNNAVLKAINNTDSLSIINNKKLLKILKDENSQYTDSMSYAFGYMLANKLFIIRKIIYENLKSNDFNVIRSDSIRTKLSFYYDGIYSYLENQQNQSKRYARNTFIVSIYKNFEQISLGRLVPNNYNKLKNDRDFKNAFSFYTHTVEASYNQNISYYVYLESFKQELDQYLSELKIREKNQHLFSWQ
ncbi:hypothetical protein OO013_16090 [Mangrovivirga sp. M17]|uniref:Phage abortive infection protein n=1 Tax=Mangrovivirga halotolerans TaxID=2993936 RepID=A0ABT3RUE8_9BACT|nr:hypothetical protein [Mangrovivirga halotolerans]MCX2745400.1 hypothetical protein [Mangrovivirga halotolerans]